MDAGWQCLACFLLKSLSTKHLKTVTFVALPLDHEGKNIELPRVYQPLSGRWAACTQLGCLCPLPWDLTLVSFRPRHAGAVLSLPFPSLGICSYSWLSYTAGPAACVFSSGLNPGSLLYWRSPEAFSVALLISVFPLSSCLPVFLSDFCVGNHRPSRTVLFEWTSQRNLPHFLNHLLWSKKNVESALCRPFYFHRVRLFENDCQEFVPILNV